MIQELQGGISVIEGVRVAGIHCGIKKDKKKDLALILFPENTKCVGFFTKNSVVSAAVQVSSYYLKKTLFKRLIIINSGCANTGLGIEGRRDVYRVIKEASKLTGINKELILMASTGEIGIPLPVELIIAGLKDALGKLGAGEDKDREAAEAIMTTDSYPKFFAVGLKLNDKEVKIGGIGKGAGMIHPKLGTTLLFFSTDAKIPYLTFKRIIKEAIEVTFNKMSVDFSCSTNDTLLFLSTSKVPIGKEFIELFRAGVINIFSKFVEFIVRDGEGASLKVLELKVKGKRAEEMAENIGKNILFKASCIGKRLSVGRLLAAIGDNKIHPKNISVNVNDRLVIDKGLILVPYVPLEGEKIKIQINTGVGREITHISSVLSPKYLELNKT